MKQKRLTQEQLEKYENKKLTSKEIIQMEERGFKIPLILKLNALQEDKISFTEDTVRDMLEFAVEREYYEKAALLHTYLESNTPSN
jgi:transcriptional regulator with XRE-family HTH domain